jgi:drug/metabolite transporter (DMT)-like permease
VLLGWAFAGESVTRRTLMAAAIIVGAVALITTAQGVQRTRARVLQGPRPATSPSPPARRRKVSGG